MEEQISHIDNLIISHFAEKLTEIQEKELMQWISESDVNKKYFLRKQEVWFSSRFKYEKDKYDSQKAYKNFEKRVSTTQQKKTYQVLSSGFVFNIVKYAASIAIICLISYFSYNQGESNLKDALSMVTVEAPMGSQTKLILPDKTLVILNAGSKISYSQDFGIDKRNVEFEGEGYFEVSHNKQLPFQVKSNSIQVKVLGTKFNFKDYPDEDVVSVYLYQGKVALDNCLKNDNEMILKPDEYMVMDKTEGKMHKAETSSVTMNGWTAGNLIFSNTRVADVVKSLSRSYGVNIHICTKGIEEYRINGSFSRKDMSIEEVMEILESTGKINYELKGNNINIY